MTKLLFPIYWIATFIAIILLPHYWSDSALFLYFIVSIVREESRTSDAEERAETAEAALERVEATVRDSHAVYLNDNEVLLYNTTTPIGLQVPTVLTRVEPLNRDAEPQVYTHNAAGRIQVSEAPIDPRTVKDILAKMRARPLPEDAALGLSTLTPASPDASLDDLAKRADAALKGDAK